MIIPMKKITVLCLDSDKVRTLEELRNLSILHTSISTNVETADVASLAKRLAEFFISQRVFDIRLKVFQFVARVISFSFKTEK